MPSSSGLKRRTFVNTVLAGSGGAMQLGRAATPVIEKSRAAALDLLKPSKRDLEHGLELHTASVVVDAYGFSPRSALDLDAYAREFNAGASEQELEDLREEMMMTRCVLDASERAEYQQAWKAAGMTCIFQNAGEESQDPMRLLKRLARFTYVTDMMRDFVAKAAGPDDIIAAKKQNRQVLYFSGNGVPITQQWNSVQDELRYIRIFFQLGIRMMHLTYNRRNTIGDGCAEPSNAGLSDFGRAVVREMNRVGVIVDVAHSGWRTSLEGAKASGNPMVASHSGAAEINRHIRCKPDEVIRAIAETGGYVGICCIPAFLGGSGDLNAMLNHIDHVKKRFGVEHVAIGTDVAAASTSSARQKVPSRASRTRYEALWPPDAFGKFPSRHATLDWTNWPLFTVGLVQRAYSDEDIQKIIGGNVLRVARAVLPRADT
jgi:membrane dipeptidase